jgi:hypothetical protein
MPQAMSAALTLDALASGPDASAMAYALAFLATLPASFVYALAGAGCLRLFQRLQARPV